MVLRNEDRTGSLPYQHGEGFLGEESGSADLAQAAAGQALDQRGEAFALENAVSRNFGQGQELEAGALQARGYIL